jgi:hypothetical protein
MTTDNFIVRIYRRDQPEHMVGQVEDIDRGCTQSFQGMEKLWRILAGDKNETRNLQTPTLNQQNPEGGGENHE